MSTTVPAAGGGPKPEEKKHAAEGSTAAKDIGDEDWTPGTPLELPQQYVDWIMAQKRRVLKEDPDEYYNRMINDPDRPEIYTPEYLEDDRQLMRDIAEQYRHAGDYLEEFQEWVRIQLKTKGRVFVDDTFLAQRAMLRQAFKECWTGMMHDEEDAKKQGGGAVESN